MEFISNPRNWFLKVKIDYDCSSKIIKSKIKLFGFIKFTLILLKHKKLSQIEIVNLSQKYSYAVIIFDHQMGGGSNFYLDEYITKFKESDKVIFLFYYRENKYLVDIICKEKTEYYFIQQLNEINFIYDLFETELFLNSLVSFEHFYNVIYYIKKVSSKLTKITIPIHDYFFVCPSINLLYKDEKYCNVTSDKKICNECFKWHKFNTNFKSIINFRQAWQDIFDLSDQILVFSNSSKEIIGKVYQINNKYKLIPHKVTWIKRPCNSSISKKCLNIGILGHMASHKGLYIMENLFEESVKLHWQFYLFGNFHSSKNHKNLTLLGSYKRDNLVQVVEKYDIDIFIMPSICPETFSYTTEEIILMNKPIICFNLGAQAERVKKYHKGYIAREISAKGLMEQLDSFIGSCQTNLN